MLLTKNRIFALAVLILIFASGCSQQSQQKSQIATLKGITLTPKSFSTEDFNDFFTKAKQAGSMVSWAGDWNELSSDKGAPYVVEGLSSKYGYIPVIEAQFFQQSGGKLLRPLDDTAKESYKTSAAAFAGKYKPEYLALGIEVNILYEKSPSDFDAFVSFYSDVYDAVKKASPDTKVFTIFQLEKMKTNNEWNLIDKFSSDIIGFTTYPEITYKEPSEIPEDYYSEILSHVSKPIAFTEIGWSGKNEDQQAAFMGRFFSLAKNSNPEFEIWSFLYDQNTEIPFNSMGLFYQDGTAKKAWSEWINEK